MTREVDPFQKVVDGAVGSGQAEGLSKVGGQAGIRRVGMAQAAAGLSTDRHFHGAGCLRLDDLAAVQARMRGYRRPSAPAFRPLRALGFTGWSQHPPDEVVRCSQAHGVVPDS
jgi:hypothetical protein